MDESVLNLESSLSISSRVKSSHNSSLTIFQLQNSRYDMGRHSYSAAKSLVSNSEVEGPDTRRMIRPSLVQENPMIEAGLSYLLMSVKESLDYVSCVGICQG